MTQGSSSAAKPHGPSWRGALLCVLPFLLLWVAFASLPNAYKVFDWHNVCLRNDAEGNARIQAILYEFDFRRCQVPPDLRPPDHLDVFYDKSGMSHGHVTVPLLADFR